MKPLRLLMIIVLAGLVAGPHAAQASGKHFTTLNAPQAGTAKGYGTWVTGINQRGDIIGYYSNTQGTYGFLLHQGKYTVLEHPRATKVGRGQSAKQEWGTTANGINTRGDVVGTYVDSRGVYHGFIWR